MRTIPALVLIAFTTGALALPATALAKKHSVETQERAARKADARHARSRGMIEDFTAANEEKRAHQESRWNEMMNDVGRPNDQKSRWLVF